MFLFLLSILTSAKLVIGVNILFLSSIASPSHHIYNSALALALVGKGHNVTLVDANVDNVSKKNYTHILLEDVYTTMDSNYDINQMAALSSTEMLFMYQEWCISTCQPVLEAKSIDHLLNYPENFFDLIVIDITGGSCLFPMIHRFNYPPTIGITAFMLPSHIAYNFGNLIYPTFVPWFASSLSTQMDFFERVCNVFYTVMDIVFRYKWLYLEEEKVAKRVFGDNIPGMEQLEKHFSLILANTDPVLDYAQPMAPNFIPVGGLHTHKSGTLPQDLKHKVDNAKHGVIVFSLGTNVRSDKLDKSAQKELIAAFGEIKQLVIWKFESEIGNLPDNVIVQKWLPQNDILGHPNVKLFIGHGGALSSQEAIFHGVPMICVPFVIDQHINARIITEKKLGIALDFRRISKNYVLEKLKEVLENPIYTQNMKNASRIFKDRMETPLERAVFWTEYVLRNGGAPFLSVQARNLPFYKAFGLDVLAFVLGLFLCVIFLLCKIIKTVIKLVACKGTSVRKSKSE